jgi:hypothetical protein
MKISILWALPVLALVGAAPPGGAAPAAQAPLSVTVTCSGMECTATAYGGSGTYIGFEWSSTAVELWETANASGADASFSCGPGYMIGVDAFVTDSNGRGAVGGTWVFCP